MSLPVVDGAGDGRTRGLAHGAALRPLIRTGLARWSDQIHAAGLGTLDDVLHRWLDRHPFEATIAAYAPDLLAEVHGIADGADVDPRAVLGLNLLDEWWWYTPFDGAACSVIALPRHHLRPGFLAQTMDLGAEVAGTCAVLRLRSGNAPDQIVVTRAGSIALMGANAAGVAVAVNALGMLPPDPEGLPVAFMVRRLLECTTLREARGVLTTVPHASGQAYTLLAPDGLECWECSGAGFALVPTHGHVWHTNHPMAPGTDERLTDPALAAWSRSHERADILKRLTPIDVEGAEAALAAVAFDGEGDPLLTVAAFSVETGRPPRVRVTAGSPGTRSFVGIAFPPGDESA